FMKRLLVVTVALVLLLVVVETASAVTHGQPDGNGHPYVGVAIQPIPSMPGFVTVCSGSALSATKFLTASHCFDASQPVFVSYNSVPPFSLSADFTQGTFHPNPNWCLGCAHGLSHFDTSDVAVITLDSPSNPGAFATLPSANQVDSLGMHTGVDVVGYGVQS